MTWQDNVSIISLIVSSLGLILSLFTLILTENVKKAVYNAKLRMVFDDKKVLIKEKVEELYDQLKDSTSGPLGSSLQSLFINEYEQDFYEILVTLEKYSNCLSLKNRNVIKKSMRFHNSISKGNTTSYTAKEMLEFVTKIKDILETDVF